MPKLRVVVAMSGGVDSSVAAALLVRQGYEVLGVTMRLWTEENPDAPRHQRRCCSVEDSEDARAVCDHLGIPHYILNYERQFSTNVVDYFVEEYAEGRTPNPCLACNQYVKFAPLLQQALALEADYLATGHYARRRKDGNGYELWRAVDPQKDQSYVLYTLGQNELAHILFPIGEHTKEEVRRIAREMDLPNADKPDSADICFIPNGDYRGFVAQRVKAEPGDIVDTAGRKLGQHEGIINFTLGQRRGLPARGGSQPMYIVDIDAATNTVVAGPEEELLVKTVIAHDLSFVAGQGPETPMPIQAKIRYRSEAAAAVLAPIDRDKAEIQFEQRQRAPTPGQALVFYQGEKVLGGGKIAPSRASFV